MKYYEAHDGEYRRRLAAGRVAWDEGAYEAFDMLPLIQRLLRESGFDAHPVRALDLGCGTGALAVFLAQRGHRVTAVDVSVAAIDAARTQAASRGVCVDFRAADACRMDVPDESFELVVDNHFLHCIVFDAEREALLQRISRMLTPDGEYWIETMVGHPDMKARPEWNLDSEGITWASAGDAQDIDGCVTRDGTAWFPIRRIRSSPSLLIGELENAGLGVAWSETVPPRDEADTGTFRARCRRAPARNNPPRGAV